jgi:hypothetical protein
MWTIAAKAFERRYRNKMQTLQENTIRSLWIHQRLEQPSPLMDSTGTALTPEKPKAF